MKKINKFNMKKLIDTHSHIYFDNYKNDINQVIERAYKNNVKRDYKMISGWLYNNYWNTNFLADESKLIKFEFVINFE